MKKKSLEENIWKDAEGEIQLSYCDVLPIEQAFKPKVLEEILSSKDPIKKTYDLLRNNNDFGYRVYRKDNQIYIEYMPILHY